MGEKLPFDEKNVQDFLENTRKINEALQIIENDPRLAPSKANLARHSGLNRNTLYNRSLMTCPAARKGEPNSANFGWPYSQLLEIKKARRRPSADKAAEPTKEQSLEDKIRQFQKQLDKSRHVAGAWFNRALNLKRERDVARREAELLRKQLHNLKVSHVEEVDRLHKQLKQSIKAVKQ